VGSAEPRLKNTALHYNMTKAGRYALCYTSITVLFFSCKTGDLNIAGTVYLQKSFLLSLF